MKVDVLGRSLACAFVLLLAAVAPARADQYFSYLSGGGIDSADCTRTAPCATLANAIAHTTTNGWIQCVDTPAYGGGIISRSVTIDCTGVRSAFYQINVTASASSTVVLRNVVIDCFYNSNPVTGLVVQVAKSVVLDHVSVQHCANGIDDGGYSAHDLVIRDSTIAQNTGHGLVASSNGGVAVRIVATNTTFASNGLTGIRVNDNVSATLVDVTLASNGTHGATAASTGGPARISHERTTASNNAGGGLLSNGQGAVHYVSNVLTTGNAYGFYPPLAGGQYVSSGNNRSVGNTVADGSVTSVRPQQ